MADNHFSMTVDGEIQNIKMSFGLLNELVRVIGDIDGVPEMSFDTELRNAVIKEIFSTRDELGNITEEVNLFTLNIDQDELVDLLAWVGEHVADFLLKQMMKSRDLMLERQDDLKSLMPTSDGSLDSPSVTPS